MSEPALTAEEWAKLHHNGKAYDPVLRIDGDGDLCIDDGFGSTVCLEEPETRHALATLALHGQPFGFTWEMVDALETAVAALYSEYDNYPMPADVEREYHLAKSAIANIAALLPPRES